MLAKLQSMFKSQSTVQFGPERPPSKWSLEDVPDPILSSIVDVLAVYAIKEHVHWSSQCCHRANLQEFPKETPTYIPFSQDLRNMSVTSKAFRANVMGRKIIHTLLLGTSDHMYRVDEVMTKETRRYVRKELAKIPKTLPNLRILVDQSQQLALTKVELPPPVDKIVVVMPPGSDRPVVPLARKRLKYLRVYYLEIHEEEALDNGESLIYPEKLQTLCQNLEEVDHVHLRFPGLASCGCSHAPRLPPAYRPGECFGKNFPKIRHLALQIPFCNVHAGSRKEAHWDAYLGWMAKSPAKFQVLTVTMIGRPSKNLMASDTEPEHFFAAMGIPLTTKEEVVGNRLNTSFILEQRDTQFERWIDEMYRSHQELDELSVIYTAMPEEKIMGQTQGYIRFDTKRILIPGKPRSFTRWNIQYLRHPDLNGFVQGIYQAQKGFARMRKPPHEDPHPPENHPFYNADVD